MIGKAAHMSSHTRVGKRGEGTIHAESALPGHACAGPSKWPRGRVDVAAVRCRIVEITNIRMYGTGIYLCTLAQAPVRYVTGCAIASNTDGRRLVHASVSAAGGATCPEG